MLLEYPTPQAGLGLIARTAKSPQKESTHVNQQLKTPEKSLQNTWHKVEAPRPKTLSWDACPITHLEAHSPMHLK
jgi:hypothetical protein